MEDNRENGMPNLLDLEEFDEEALKKESEEVLQMRILPMHLLQQKTR